MFDRFRYPVALRVPPEERERALWWLLKNHPKLDCRTTDAFTGELVVRVRREDGEILESLADGLGLKKA